MDNLRFRSKLSGKVREYAGTMVDQQFTADDGKLFLVDGLGHVYLVGTERDVLTGERVRASWFAAKIRVGEVVT